MLMQSNHSVSLRSFRLFQKLGYLLGGILPVIIYIMFEICGFNQNITTTTGNTFSNIIFITFLGAVMGIIALLFETKDLGRWYFNIFFTCQALFSFGLIHTLVFYTGGSKSSVFAFTYLYLPTIVGHVYGRGVSLYGAIIGMGLSYYCNLFFQVQQRPILDRLLVSSQYFKSMQTHENQKSSDVIYLLVFGIQLIVTVIIASKQSFAERTIT